MNTNIESHLTENRKFKPRKSFSKHAHISSFERYEKLYRKSIKDPKRFWAKQASELLVWHKKWKKVLEWKEPFAKWFIGGQLNASENCLDRHLTGARKHKAALIWESEPGEKKRSPTSSSIEKFAGSAEYRRQISDPAALACNASNNLG